MNKISEQFVGHRLWRDTVIDHPRHARGDDLQAYFPGYFAQKFFITTYANKKR